MALPALLPVPEIHERLGTIFPEGTAHRNFLIREMAAKTVFTMLYVGALHGTGCWLRPDQVTRMTDHQAASTNEEDRIAWREASLRPTNESIVGRWYAANTREPIRDETLREGLIRTGAVRERGDLPTTSPAPRYALDPDFAALFDPGLAREPLEAAIAAWQEQYLSAGALARVAILRRGTVAAEDRVLVTFPNGETRHMEPGPSSIISKAVVEEFAPRFLENPGVIWLSESRNKVVARDDELAQAIGLEIQPNLNLPDLILVDLGSAQPLIVFVEVVASAGPVSESRKDALMSVATEAGFAESQVAFISAFADRNHAAFKRSVSELAWRSFAWFMAEPDHIMVLRRGADASKTKLSDLMDRSTAT